MSKLRRLAVKKEVMGLSGGGLGKSPSGRLSQTKGSREAKQTISGNGPAGRTLRSVSVTLWPPGKAPIHFGYFCANHGAIL